MKLVHTTIILAALINSLVRASPTNNDDTWKHHRCDPKQCDSARATPVRGTVQQGKPFPPTSIIISDDDGREEEGPSFPLGHITGPIVPSSPPTNLTGPPAQDHPALQGRASLTQRQQCPRGNNVVINSDVLFSNDTGRASDPSGSIASNVVFTTANWLAAVSIDFGSTFHTLDASMFSGPAVPATDAGFCCDQIVQYIPQIDRFVWLIQYAENAASNNRLRLILFHPRDVTITGPSSFLYVDIASTDLGLTNILDAGELAIGNKWLWLSANNAGTGLVVMKLPISALDVVGTFTYWSTDPANSQTAYLSRISQNPGDTVFWAGHSQPGTNMQIFKWPESSTTYSWTDLRIHDWPADTTKYFSACPSAAGTNWAFDADANRILGSTRRANSEVWFAWNAPPDSGFPNIHIQIVKIDVSNWPNNLRVIDQVQIWSDTVAYAYPAFFTGVCGDVGFACMFGGGTWNPTSAVGVFQADGGALLGSQVQYTELSDGCEARNGDYVTVRQDFGTGWQGYVYDKLMDAAGSLHGHSRVLQFGRG